VLTDKLFAPLGLHLEDLFLTPTMAEMLLASSASTAACPRCGTTSHHVPSRYRRTVADLPCQDRTVALRTARLSPAYLLRTPTFLEAHARATGRLTTTQQALGLALGGEAGSRWQPYGSILLDLDRGRVLELLRGRDGTELKTWHRPRSWHGVKRPPTLPPQSRGSGREAGATPAHPRRAVPTPG
jgi:hypothetical protein